jgi:hypothetical protein
MALQSLILPILSVFRSAGLQQASGALRSLTGNFTSLAGQIGLAAGSFSAFSALTAARQFTVDAVNSTAQFERNILGLKQVFEEMEPQMRAFTREVENYGLSQSQAAQASVFLGSVLKQYGFSVSASAGQTERLVTLAQDLATTYGYDVQEALLAITALFRGEYDPIEKFGVAMKQNEVNARIAAQGLGDLEGAALANAQAIARLEMLFERAGDAVGAFTRASDTLYGSQQRLNAVIGNLQLAFGAPLQQPLAAINNLFADLAQEYGPEIIEIGNSIGGVIGALTPIINVLGNTFMLLLAPLQQVIDLLSFVTTVVTGALSPAIVVINGLLATFNSVLDAGTALLGLFGTGISKAADDSDKFKLFLESLGIDPDKENSLESYVRRIDQFTGAVNRASGQNTVFGNTLHMADLAMVSAATEATNLANKGKTIEDAFRTVATGATDAEGKLLGLAGVFQTIDDAMAQSKAKQEMENLGLSAAFIEEVLKRPNWKAIFQDIATYARLAAIEVSSIFDRTGESIRFIAELENQKGTLLERINKAFAQASKNTGSTKKSAKDSVKDFFDTMADEIRKQTAREYLRTQKASEGLIDAILGSEAWEKLVKRIQKGTTSLQDLQKQFSQTAAGVKELQDAQAQYEADLERYNDEVKRINDRLADELQAIREKADAAKLAMSDLLEGFVILTTIEREIGRFESQVVQMLASVEQSLRSAFRNKDILEEGYNALRKYAQQELSALQQVGRQRDEFAKRYDLAKDLIDQYKRAFTAAMSLTSLFGNLKDETEKRTVTVVTSGVVKLGAALREFGVTITRSFEEPIAKIQNKSAALVDEFRNMATKARAFATNLRELQKMGLNDQLFNELVQAGVVAGGETAQALVDGGAATIDEINMLFAEIDAIGADLGEQVATSLYGSGINMMDGLLAGIRSKQEELENTARTLAEAFNKEFQSKFNIQVGVAQSAAEQAARDKAAADIAALGPEPTAPIVPNAALSALDAMIANANKFIGTAKQATNAMGAIAKREIFEDLRAAIAGGANIDISGIRPGMTSADIVKAVQPQAPNIVNNAFYIQPGNRANQNATVESLKQFINQNGNLVGYGIQ